MLRLVMSLLLMIGFPSAFADTIADKPAADKMDSPPASNTPTQNQSFLEENKKKPGVITLPSGLQYKIIKEGTGQPPGPTDFVTVHYRGTLVNGKEFDSSYKNNQPAIFAVNMVIPGWQEALKLMKPGSKWMLYIPPNLAYGEKGAGRLIEPNSTLIFEVELLSVKSSPDTDQDGIVEEWEGLD